MTTSVRRFHVGDRLSEIAVHQGTVYLAGSGCRNGFRILGT